MLERDRTIKKNHTHRKEFDCVCIHTTHIINLNYIEYKFGCACLSLSLPLPLSGYVYLYECDAIQNAAVHNSFSTSIKVKLEI